jgi:outer membrane immunogenic protein
MRGVSCPLTLALVTVSVATANAGDWPIKTPADAPYNWTGLYAGGHAGYAWGTAGTTLGFIDPTGDVAAAVAAGVIPVNFSSRENGPLGGIQIGYNYQLCPTWVVGLETDFSFSDRKGAQTINTAVPLAIPLTESVSDSLTSFGTIRARIGYAANNWLFFATSGGAYGHANYGYSISNVAGGGQVNFTGSDSGTQWGWTGGGGVEYGWSRWTARVEYLYDDLGSHSFVVPANVPPGAAAVPNTETTGQIVRAAFNYRFQ